MSTPQFSKAGLARMHAAMARHIGPGQMPGLVTAVCRGGEVHVDVIGQLAFDGAPLQRDSIFRIASMTKPVAAVAAMILVEECKLRLDDPVDAFLPELANRKVLKRIDGPITETVPAHRAVTLRDILTFTLGFGLHVPLPPDTPIIKAQMEVGITPGLPYPLTVPPPDEWMRRIGALPFMCQPGERWLYNTGSDILGVLIARASGQPFAKFLEERIFAPLGMKDTAFYAPPDKVHRLAVSYHTNYVTGAFEIFDKAAGGQWAAMPDFPSGAAGLVSTIDDYLTFGRMMLSKGIFKGQRILSSATVETMIADQLTPAQKAISGLTPQQFDSNGWGLGMAVVTKRTDVGRPVGQFGWDGGLGTSWYADITNDMTGVLLTQQAWKNPAPQAVTHDFWTSAYQAFAD